MPWSPYSLTCYRIYTPVCGGRGVRDKNDYWLRFAHARSRSGVGDSWSRSKFSWSIEGKRCWFDGLICGYHRCRLRPLYLAILNESHSEEQQSGDDNDIAGGCTWLFGVRQESGSVRHVLGPAFGFAGRPFLAGSNYSDRLLWPASRKHKTVDCSAPALAR